MPTVLYIGPSAFAFKYSDVPRYPHNLVRNIVREPAQRYGRGNGNPKNRPGPEAILHKAWRNAGLAHAEVRGRDGHNYRIVYGGKPGGSLGPDFTDAVVERDDGSTFRGDVEIHVRESDWRAHGHHTDPRYNGVVLHVVASESDGRPALKATGASIPLLALNWNKPRRTSANPRPSGSGTVLSEELSGKHLGEPVHQTDATEMPPPRLSLDLAAAGLERFHSQAAGIALEIEAFGPDQALWLGILGALGYPRNKRAFRAVGTRIDWGLVSSCESATEVEGMLLYASGLSGPDGASKTRRLPLRGSSPEWVRPFGRPANAPAVRIKAISALVPQWANGGGIARAAQQIVSRSERTSDLWRMFRPPELVQDKNTTVLGAARAAEIVVNVLLPTLFAMTSSDNADPVAHTSLRNRVLKLYSSHPKLSANSLTTEARIALGIDHDIPEIKTARDQQGLIVLYREMTRRGIRARQPRLPGV